MAGGKEGKPRSTDPQSMMQDEPQVEIDELPSRSTYAVSLTKRLQTVSFY